MGGRGQYPTGTRTGELPLATGGAESKQFDVTKPPFTDINGNNLININSISGFERLMQMDKNLLDFETAWVSDDKGRLIAGARGGKGSVAVNLPISEYKGKTYTHNHPGKYGGAFSDADIALFTTGRMKEIRAVANEGTYSLKANKGADYMGFNRAMNRQLDILKSRAATNQRNAKAAGKSRVEQRMAYTDTFSNWYKANAHKFGFTYTTKADRK